MILNSELNNAKESDDPAQVIKTDLSKKLTFELNRNRTTVSKHFRIGQDATDAGSKFTIEDFKKMDLLPLTQVLGTFMPVVPLTTTQQYLLGTEVRQMVVD